MGDLKFYDSTKKNNLETDIYKVRKTKVHEDFH